MSQKPKCLVDVTDSSHHSTDHTDTFVGSIDSYLGHIASWLRNTCKDSKGVYAFVATVSPASLQQSVSASCMHDENECKDEEQQQARVEDAESEAKTEVEADSASTRKKKKCKKMKKKDTKLKKGDAAAVRDHWEEFQEHDFHYAATSIADACVGVVNPSQVFSTLRGVATNLLKDDVRYCTLDTTNPKVMEQFIDIDGVHHFLNLLGFESDATGTKLVCCPTYSSRERGEVQRAISVLAEYAEHYTRCEQ